MSKKRQTLQERNIAENMSPRGMARSHIAWIRIYRSPEPGLSEAHRLIYAQKAEERLVELRLALSDRKAAVSACLTTKAVA